MYFLVIPCILSLRLCWFTLMYGIVRSAEIPSNGYLGTNV